MFCNCFPKAIYATSGLVFGEVRICIFFIIQVGGSYFFVVSQPQPQALPIIELHTFSHIVMDFDTIPTTNGHFFAKYLFIYFLK
jgi:hypothetical protein